MTEEKRKLYKLEVSLTDREMFMIRQATNNPKDVDENILNGWVLDFIGDELEDLSVRGLDHGFEHGCDHCDGKGWDIYQGNDNRFVIQRCDSCESFEDDVLAGEKAFTLIYDALRYASIPPKELAECRGCAWWGHQDELMMEPPGVEGYRREVCPKCDSPDITTYEPNTT